MSVEELVVIGVLATLGWTLMGETILSEYEQASEVYRQSKSWDEFHPYFNPVWLYRNYNVNFFGAFLLTILFNLLSPFVSAIYWIGIVVKWIATVGRKD